MPGTLPSTAFEKKARLRRAWHAFSVSNTFTRKHPKSRCSHSTSLPPPCTTCACGSGGVSRGRKNSLRRAEETAARSFRERGCQQRCLGPCPRHPTLGLDGPAPAQRAATCAAPRPARVTLTQAACSAALAAHLEDARAAEHRRQEVHVSAEGQAVDKVVFDSWGRAAGRGFVVIQSYPRLAWACNQHQADPASRGSRLL